MAGEKDIIDEAMADDTYDYGDKTPASEPNQQEEVVAKEPAQSDPNTLLQPEGEKPAVGKLPLTGQQPAQQPTQQQPQLKKVGSQFADGKGNIVDKDGKIIATAGENARLWSEASRAKAQVDNLTRQLTAVTQQQQQNTELLARAQEIAELPKRLGVSREDYQEGVTLMSRWRADPVGVAREIVARTLTFGHNVSDILGKNAGDALEMKAVTSLVNQATAPLKQQQEAAARDAEQKSVADRSYATFIGKYPDAELHGNEIAHLMQKGDNAEVAYYKVKNFAIENGLDFSQPLAPQVDALRTQRSPQAQRPTAAPLPNGSRAQERQMQSDFTMADASDDWGSILRSVLPNN